MLVLVICRPVPDGDQSVFRDLVASELAALRQLKQDGTLTEAWSPGRPGAVLILDAADEAAAAGIAAGLPLAAAGQITTEIIPLHPLSLLASPAGRARALSPGTPCP